jgi:uncharacterized iron-regulated membrane protein
VPLRLRVPLPGPFVYSTQVGGRRRARQTPKTPGQVLGFAAVLGVVMCFLLPQVGASILIAVVITWVGWLVIKRRSRRRDLRP